MDLKLEDLFTKCERCNGTGYYEEVSRNGTKSGTCPNCAGRGGSLTESGETLKEFINIINTGRFY